MVVRMRLNVTLYVLLISPRADC